MNKFNNQVIEEIINKYISKYTINRLAKDYNCSSITIKYILAKYKLYNIDLKINIKDLVNDYNIGMSVTKIAEKYNCRRQSVVINLLNANIVPINRQNETKFNEHIFDSIDTEEKAYWLGFIFADGYISSHKQREKPKYTFEVSLKGDDIGHLYKLQTFLQCKVNKVKTSVIQCNNRECTRCRIILTNKHLWETLNSYGCTPKKSLTLKFPDESIFKSKDLIRHFIRGYFDGDGCFSRVKNKSTVSPVISLIGTKEFLLKIYQLYNIDGVFLKDKRRNGNTFTLALHREYGINFIDLLYNNASIYLDRKYNLYLFFKEGCRSLKEFNEFLLGNIEGSPNG